MSLANDSILVTPGTGATVATHLASAKEHQVVVEADDTGHIKGTVPTYRLFVPAGAAGASKVYLDLFNATASGKTLRILSVRAIKDGSVAVVGALSVKLHLTRTTAVGTTGTAATVDGTSLTAPALAKMDPANAALPAGVTARMAPGGGATAGVVICERHIFSEETTGASYDPIEFLNPNTDDIQPLVVPENTGIRIVQGAVASVGNTGFDVLFEAV